MRDWISVLGREVTTQTPTVNFLKNELAKLLNDRVCLLVLDDVWERAHAEAFLISGSRSHLLMTTRDAEIARELGANIHFIAPMNEQEAVQLLEKWADGKLQSTPSQLKAKVVNRLGYLPLAIRLAGTQLRDEEPQSWLDTFDILLLQNKRYSGHHHDSFLQTVEL